MDLRNSNGIELTNLYFTTIHKLFLKISSEVENASFGAQFKYFQSK